MKKLQFGRKPIVLVMIVALLCACTGEGEFKYVGPVSRNAGKVTMEDTAFMRCVSDKCLLEQGGITILMETGDIAIANGQVLVDPVTLVYTGTLEIVEAANVQARIGDLSSSLGITPTVGISPTVTTTLAATPAPTAVSAYAPGQGNLAGQPEAVTDTTQGTCEAQFPIKLVEKAALAGSARA
ncbi:MAG: hypothetical protein PHG63_02915, partial [Candidatus Dojkabacteria bacterium]|nr:hypothetical protein [Candidatus Dojkabacteria bacterium]